MMIWIPKPFGLKEIIFFLNNNSNKYLFIFTLYNLVKALPSGTYLRCDCECKNIGIYLVLKFFCLTLQEKKKNEINTYEPAQQFQEKT